MSSAVVRAVLACCVLALGASFANAQAAATPAAAAPTAATTPGAAPATAAAVAAPAEPATVAAPAPAEATTTAAPAAAPAAVPAATTAAEQARVEREADRARLRLLLARARAERAAVSGQRAEPINLPAPQPEVRHGDAGAAIAVAASIELPWNTDPGFDVFSEDDVATRFGVWATYDLLAIREDIFVAAGAGIDFESTEDRGLLGGQLDSNLDAIAVYATGVVRYVPVSWLQPHVRLSGGAQRVNVQLDVAFERFKDAGTLPFGSLGAGFTLRSPTRLFESKRGTFAALSFGVMVEAGYALVAPLEVTLDGDGPAETDIALAEAELGELERSGPFMRVSLVARF